MNSPGGHLAADLLIDAGYRRFGFVAGLEDASSSQDREAGFLGRLEEKGFARPRRAVGHHTYAGGLLAARALLGRGERPDALFCANDVMALAVIDVARGECSLRVPDDLGVIGFDNTPSAGLSAYALSSIDQDVERSAAQALDLLLETWADPTRVPELRLIPWRAAVRGTTAR